MYSRPASLLHSMKACAFWGVFISKQGHSKGETMGLGIHLGLPHWVPREAILRSEFFFCRSKNSVKFICPPECGTQKIFSWNLIVLAYSIDNVRSPKKSAVDVQNVIVLPQGMSLWSQTFWLKVDKKIWLKRGPFFGWRMHFSSNIFFWGRLKMNKKIAPKENIFLKRVPKSMYFYSFGTFQTACTFYFHFFFLHLHSWTWRISVFVHSRELTYQRERDTVCEYMPALSIRLANKLMVYLQE